MADKYTFKVVSTCSGGEHITIDILRNDEPYKTRTFSREDIKTGEFQTWDKIASLIIAKVVKNSVEQTETGYINAIESTVISL